MAELTLKDESVIQIGESVSKGFNDLVASGKSILINPAGQPLTQSAADIPTEDDFIGPRMPENNMMSVLESIRDGIQSLVESFADSLSFQKQEEREAERADRISKDDPPPPPTGDEGDKKGGIFAGAMARLAKIKEGASNLMGKGGFLGLLIKGGLIAGLLLLAKTLQKYGAQIAEKITPIVDGIKDFFNGLFNIVTGIFTLDGDKIKEGIGVLKELAIKIGTFFIDLTNSILTTIGELFGIEGLTLTKIKNFFVDIKNKVVESFDNAISFFTEDIPAKVTEIRDSVKQFFTDAFDKIKNGVKDAFSSVGNFFSDLGDSVKTLVNSAIDALPLPGFIKKKLKLETKASRAADDRVTETGIKGKYTDDSITGMQRERMTGGMGTMEEGFAEATGEKYGTAKITKSGTAGYDFASGVLTPEQFTEYNKLDTDGQLEYLKNLDEEEQKRREMILKLKQDKIDHDKRLAKMIEEGKALQPEFGGEIISPDDQLLQDDMAYARRTKQMREDSAAMDRRDQAKVNVINNTGGSTNTSVANNSYTNIAEDTNTSDNRLRDAFSA
jgi:hypothetical protein